MDDYYVNKHPQDNGDYEVHASSCPYMPSSANAVYLGVFFNCRDAMEEARKRYPQANGCNCCCRDCHKS